MVTGGIAPNPEGGVFAGASGLYYAPPTSPTTGSSPTASTTRAAGSRCRSCMPGATPIRQDCVAPSPVKSPISPFPPRELDEAGIEKQIADIATAAARAREAGYDGVEVMGSEGYFLNQFLVTHTNKRSDRWGGAYAEPDAAAGRGGAPGARRGRGRTSS